MPSAAGHQFDEALAAARAGSLTPEGARVLLDARGEEQLAGLLQAAAEARDAWKGRAVSFSKKVFIPLTNLCRDYCGYCTFRKDPGQPGARTLTPDEVLALAEAGRRLGCKEALFSLGDRPEARFPEARDFLKRVGHRTTLSYLAQMCERVLHETGLLPHTNAGLLPRNDLEALRRSNSSMGLMLESKSERLCAPGQAHARAPDKRPAPRLRTIEEAGRLRIPFTTGILIGIGETTAERVDALFAIRALHRRHGHIQEVIIQNFRPKPDIPMRDHAAPRRADHARTVAVARLVLGAVNVQAPPNLSDDYSLLLRAGINDWGGISPLTCDFINPERPWPHLEALRARTDEAGLELKERLNIYPEFLRDDEFLDPSVAAKARPLADASGYAA